MRDLYAAFSRGDAPFVLERLPDDVVFENSNSPEMPHGGSYSGKEGVGKFFGNFAGAFEVSGFEPTN